MKKLQQGQSVSIGIRKGIQLSLVARSIMRNVVYGLLWDEKTIQLGGGIIDYVNKIVDEVALAFKEQDSEVPLSTRIDSIVSEYASIENAGLLFELLLSALSTNETPVGLDVMNPLLTSPEDWERNVTDIKTSSESSNVMILSFLSTPVVSAYSTVANVDDEPSDIVVVWSKYGPEIFYENCSKLSSRRLTVSDAQEIAKEILNRYDERFVSKDAAMLRDTLRTVHDI